MQSGGVFLFGIVAGAALTASCSGPDPGAITFAERASGGADTTPQGTTTGPSDAGGGGDPIFGKELFAWVDPGIVANNANAKHEGTVVGKDCISAGCHLDNGKQWLFAGTMYTSAAGGATVAKGEVRLIGPDGNEVGHTYTDANGNFWLEKAGSIPANTRVGIRKEGAEPRSMVATLQPVDKGCNANRSNCHGTAITGKVYIP